jgi:teichoic acid transport system permease protein
MARLTVHLRDVSQLVPVISRLLFYTSGVLFDVNRIFEQYPLRPRRER